MLNGNCVLADTQCTWEKKENNKDLSWIRTNTQIQDRIDRTVEVNKHTDTVTKTRLDLSAEKPCLPLCKQSLLQSYTTPEDNFVLIIYFILPNLHFVHFIYIFNVKMGFLVVATGSCNLIKRRKFYQLDLIEKHSDITWTKLWKSTVFYYQQGLQSWYWRSRYSILFFIEKDHL